jgi:anti-sigma regulatory factor (Ser/Thr protein kinase)
MRQITLTIESDIQNLGLVAVAVHRICEHLGAGQEESHQLEMCVNEAVANCIHHAYLNAPGQLVTVRVRESAGAIECDVCDNGISVPGAKLELLEKGHVGDESFQLGNRLFEERGRGLKIIAALMDEVVYLRDGATNCLRMTKKTRGARQPQ